MINEQQRNLILAIVISVAIVLGFEFFVKKDKPKTPPPQTQSEQMKKQDAAKAAPQKAPSQSAQSAQQSAQQKPAAPVTAPGGAPQPTTQQTGAPSIPMPDSASIPQAPGDPAAAATMAKQSRAALLKQSPRIRINAPRLHGSIALKGGRIDDLTLANYHETLDPKSAEIVLLSPSTAQGGYFAEFGWVAGGGATPVPDSNTLWQADRQTLTAENPVTLSWNNGKGLTFKRTIAVDKDYLFTITQRVENDGGQAVTLYPYGLILRRGTPKVTGFYILHEGLLGVFNGVLQEVDYEDIRDKKTIQNKSTGGWIGITDKYWLTALVPDQKNEVNTRFFNRKEQNLELYQTDYLGKAVVVQPKGSAQASARFFGGAKEMKTLTKYMDQQNIAKFDLAIDWGWFWFLTKPIFVAMIWIYDFVKNYGVAIILLTIAIKIVFFPLANKSYEAMSKMKKLQPEMEKLRDRFKEDKQRLNQEMMALYKREGANPASGCLPILIQIPVFFALYKVLFVTIEMRHAPFFGWIHDLSAPDPTTLFNLFGLIPWTPPEFLMIGVWPLIMGGSMYLQQMLNPQPADPVQAKIFMFLPLVFTILLAQFPAGLVIYWAVNNVLSIAQQWVIMKRMGTV
ncbi:MAG: membrane protein insertase YidC [Rhodospirillales bacterium]